ncbi:Tol-Pal system beta propeller repeat protein TolB [Paracoccus salipaludis]|uniref:Tol-Pal system protein TolB n=1 Tax=Paracoccus salipaludis TaxID=2032623 RepID=A0A2A2GJY2_9RHOB|nr:Tol-Pal system beta propeller repeat protein TolB [Paracoccus salipaludis]PAU97821.1 Tol-Pal system beta propeller repeat protein TolB [Paracoccus salipaludis]
MPFSASLARLPLVLAAALVLAGPAAAQDAAAPLALPATGDEGPLRIEITGGQVEPMPIAIAPFFDEGGAAEMAARIQEVVTADLTGTDLFREIPASAHVARPSGFDDPVAYPDWRAVNAEALILGSVALRDGQVTARFRLFDVFSGQPLGDGMQFDAPEAGWRRVAHKLADQVYARITGEGPYFDSRVTFVSETGPKDARLKRIGIMDYDGANPLWVTDDSALVVSPRFSPDGSQLLYTSFGNGMPQVMLMDVATVQSRPLKQEAGTMSFAPRFSPDGRWIVYSREKGGNTDIWQMDVATGAERPLTETAAIETSPFFSPDGRQIVFESDQSGTQQIYVMPADGSAEPARISFGEGSYGTPAWSPTGDLIAFTKRNGDKFHIGVMRPDGTEEKLLTESFLDEGPSWAPNGRVVMFTRQTPGGDGTPRLHSVDVTGRNMRPLSIEGAASDPDWGPLLP